MRPAAESTINPGGRLMALKLSGLFVALIGKLKTCPTIPVVEAGLVIAGGAAISALMEETVKEIVSTAQNERTLRSALPLMFSSK